ncbi:MAG: hypothetical protein FWB97_02660 [Oscillospiraceae bacterium]|nr:hypothetical protein [Oscillospiraceae bacterium]
MRHHSKATLFLIEQLIVIAIFAICAAVCISIFANAYFMARDSRDISNALLAAESVAESFKAVSGDFLSAADISGGWAETVDGADAIIVFFDSNWRVSDESEAQYILRLVRDNPPKHTGLLTSELTVSRTGGGNLVTFPVAVRLQAGN